MKLFLPGNDGRCSQVFEDGSQLEAGAESEKVGLFRHGHPAPTLDAPLKVRIHYRPAKPLPLPDFCRGNALMFVSARGKAIIERHCGDCAQFIPVEVAGCGLERGGHWTPASLADAPWADRPVYYVLHVPQTAPIIDLDASTIVRDSIGELPDLMPAGQFHRVAFDPDAVVPPLFALPFHGNFPVVSEDFVAMAKREKLAGFKPAQLFDTSAGLPSEEALPPDDTPLVSLREALEIAARHRPGQA